MDDDLVPLIVGGEVKVISRDLYSFVCEDALARGISKEEAYREEMAEQELDKAAIREADKDADTISHEEAMKKLGLS